MSTLRVALIGNVDSGKSTLTSVLLREGLDDGRGSARKSVFVHPHEEESGRTSSISMQFLTDGGQNICLVDLCGHERYLKTTLFGLNLVKPNYCLLLVGANMGVSRITRQHFQTVIALGYPVIVVVTKIDISPKHILRQTILDIKGMVKRVGGHTIDCLDPKTIIPTPPKVVPLLKISNVTGEGLEILRETLCLLQRLSTSPLPSRQITQSPPKPPPQSESPPAKQTNPKSPPAPLTKPENLPQLPSTNNPVEYLVDNVYQVKGVGVVISGFVQDGTVHKDKRYLLSLAHSQRIVEVTVKCIHNESDDVVTELPLGRHGTLLIKAKGETLNKEDIRRGNALLSQDNCILSREFVALIYIFHHQTTLQQKDGRRPGYQCIVNCNGIRQSAELVSTNNKSGILRTNDRCKARFRFVYHEEFVKPGTVFSFREGSTIGVGRVVKTIGTVSR